MTGFKTFICSCVYFHFHTDDGLSKNRNVCTYCYAHKIMKFITFALVFSFILCCWPKTKVILWCSGWCLGLLCGLLLCSGWCQRRYVGYCGVVVGFWDFCVGFCGVVVGAWDSYVGYSGVVVDVWDSYVGYCGVVVGVWDSNIGYTMV